MVRTILSCDTYAIFNNAADLHHYHYCFDALCQGTGMQAAVCGQAEQPQGARNCHAKVRWHGHGDRCDDPDYALGANEPIYQGAINRDADYCTVRCGGRHKGFEPLHQIGRPADGRAGCNLCGRCKN